MPLPPQMMGWQWHQMDHMQIICASLQTDNYVSTSPRKIFYRLDALPATQPTASKHWRQKATSQNSTTTSTFHMNMDALLDPLDCFLHLFPVEDNWQWLNNWHRSHNSRGSHDTITQTNRRQSRLQCDHSHCMNSSQCIDSLLLHKHQMSADLLQYSMTHHAWPSGSLLISINKVILHQVWLVLGWVTICRRVNHLGLWPANQANSAIYPQLDRKRVLAKVWWRSVAGE